MYRSLLQVVLFRRPLRPPKAPSRCRGLPGSSKKPGTSSNLSGRPFRQPASDASQGLQALEHPVRAPSKETKGLEPPPNPNWHSSGLDKSSLQTQIHLFKIGSIQSRRRLKKTKGLEPPPNPNRHPSGLDKSSFLGAQKVG